jgi:hypothetical protein
MRKALDSKEGTWFTAGVRSRVLGVLFVLTLVAAALCLNYRRGPSPAQIAPVPTQPITQMVANVPNSNFVVDTQIFTERVVMQDVFGNQHEVSASEYFRSRSQSQDLIDFRTSPVDLK